MPSVYELLGPGVVTSWTSLIAQLVKNPPAMQEILVREIHKRRKGGRMRIKIEEAKKKGRGKRKGGKEGRSQEGRNKHLLSTISGISKPLLSPDSQE